MIRSLSSTFLTALATSAVALTALGTTSPAWATRERMVTYEVTVTNLTYNQQFTPLLLVTHRSDVAMFTPGQPASVELATLAEGGDVVPLRTLLQGNPHVTATETGNSLLDPGKSVTFQIKANPWRDRLSLAAMLIPTNDAFVALNGVSLPHFGQSASTTAVAYDAGSEINDELCSSIPGPMFVECGGSGGGAKVGGGEGFVHVHRGMHGIGDFKPSDRDWRNPVAKVQVRMVR